MRWLQDANREQALARLRECAKRGGRPLAADECDLRGIQLAGLDLSGLDLSGIDLTLANLSEADLSNSRFSSATLRGANLFGANISGCEFLQADLSEVDLSECKARSTGFGNAVLDDAVMFNTDFNGASFTKARLHRVDLRAANLKAARFLESDLTAADFTQAVMQDADMECSNVSRALFVNTDLRGARFSGMLGYDASNWIGADINGVNFCAAYLVRRTIEDQNYLHEFRAQNRLNAAIYWVWWLTSDCGRSFLRWGLWTLLIVALFGGAYEFVALDLGDYPTFLSSLYFSVVTLTTLGYGDVLPASPVAQLMAMFQVVIGYVMLGGLLSIFSNKMARRAS